MAEMGRVRNDGDRHKEGENLNLPFRCDSSPTVILHMEFRFEAERRFRQGSDGLRISRLVALDIKRFLASAHWYALDDPPSHQAYRFFRRRDVVSAAHEPDVNRANDGWFVAVLLQRSQHIRIRRQFNFDASGVNGWQLHGGDLSEEKDEHRVHGALVAGL